jgi:hypothetical protein
MCLWDLIGNFEWHYGDCCIGGDYYMMICWFIVVVNVGHYLINNVLIILCYIAKSVFGCDTLSWYHTIIGGHGCPVTSASTSSTVICATGLKYNIEDTSASSIPQRLLKHHGM